MVFNSSMMVAVADVSADKWQRMRRVRSSEMMNSEQLLEIACCFPFGHLFLCLWEALIFTNSDDSANDSSSSDDDDTDSDDADDEDMLAFDHNDCALDHHHGSSSSSTFDFDDYRYSHSD